MEGPSVTIGSIAAASAASASPASLGMQDFMKVLLTQLTYQDPLKPMDNQAFMAQIAQFTALEQTQRLNDRVQQLVDNQAALQSVGLIGRTVDVLSNGTRSTGTVASLSLQGDLPLLTLTLAGGATLPDVSLAQVVGIR
jgi:flagellar basal-body rod modification protein FlgD